MQKIFDGKKLAQEKRQKLGKIIKEKDLHPKLVTILVGEDPASTLYVNLKKKAGEEIGAEVVIKNFPEDVTTDKVIQFIESENKDNSINGIMVQMPLPKNVDKEKIINTIDPKKDVDGLRDDSEFIHPTVLAILEILKISNADQGSKILVVGSKGMVGNKLLKELEKDYQNIDGLDVEGDLVNKIKTADVVISATGKSNLINGNMVKDGVVAIDVGAPKGDFEFHSVSPKACFITPVPGGVGPLTILFLLENLLNAGY